MPHALKLTHGSTTLTLTDNSAYMLNQYVPGAPTQSAVGYEPVTETIEVTVIGATTAATVNNVRAVERLLHLASERQRTGKGQRVWLKYTPTGDTEWRAEVLDGRFVAGNLAAQGYGQKIMEYRLHVTRSYFWEGTRTQIPLTNANGTNDTAGLTIYNHDDSGTGHDNYVQIAAADVVGALPAPIELRMENTDGAARSYLNFRIANNRWSTSFAQIIEGESAISGYGTSTANGSASAGAYATLTGSGYLTFRWYVPSATLEIVRGRYVRVLARFWTFPSAVRAMQLRVYDWSGLVARSPAQSVYSTALGTSYFHDCGVVQLPPTEMSDDTEAWKDVVLELKITTSGSETMAVDYIMLMPAEEGCYRHFVQEGYSIASGEEVVDGGHPTQTYSYDGANRFEIYTAQSAPLLIWPGEAQRLYFAWDGSSGAISWTLAVQAFYRPRRLTF